MALSLSMLGLILLSVCGSYQDGNFTSNEVLYKVVSVAVLPTATLGISSHLGEGRYNASLFPSSIWTSFAIQTSLFTVAAATTAPSAPRPIHGNYTITQAGPSSQNISVDCTNQAENSGVAASGAVPQPSTADLPGEHHGNGTSRPDDDSSYGGNAPQDLSSAWVRHLRSKARSKKKPYRLNSDLEDESILKPPKRRTTAGIGVAALLVGALGFVTMDQEKRRKRPQIGEQEGTTSEKEPLSPLPAREPDDASESAEPYIILQLETRPISHHQLVAEVEGIYAGLVSVERKCIEVDQKLTGSLASSNREVQSKLNNEQWQALIALHRTLIHDHHDFFLASQHPSANSVLRRLALKYDMPVRMWRHGIHAMLEIMRHRLPDSMDHMVSFIYLSYSLLTSLYESVPAFKDTWIECLGDLARYRMAIECEDARDREVWAGVARHWYLKASDSMPATGRLYHHLAILARPNNLEQLFNYCKSLSTVVPFTAARESILSLFDPLYDVHNGRSQPTLVPLHAEFMKAHGILFAKREIERLKPIAQHFLELLDDQVQRCTQDFKEDGCHIAIANCVSMLGFASDDSILMREISSSSDNDGDTQMDENAPGENHLSVPDENGPAMTVFRNAEWLSIAALEIVLQKINDPNVLPFIHIALVFMYYMSGHSNAACLLREKFPWDRLAFFLNTLLEANDLSNRFEKELFPLPEGGYVRPLPEDSAMRGLFWTENYFPADWFVDVKIDEDEKYTECASMTAQRKERILWLAIRLTKCSSSVLLDSQAVMGRSEWGLRQHWFFTNSATSHYLESQSPRTSPPRTKTLSHNNSFVADCSTCLPDEEELDDAELEMHGINATLALPADSFETSVKPYYPSLEALEAITDDLLPSTATEHQEISESWLSTFVNSGTDSDDKDGLETLQICSEGKISSSLDLENNNNKPGQSLSLSVPTDLMVLFHDTEDGSDESQEVVGADEEKSTQTYVEPIWNNLITPPHYDDSKNSPITPLPAELSTDGHNINKNQSSKPQFPALLPTPTSTPLAFTSPETRIQTPPNHSQGHKCPYCPRTYPRKSDLNKHIKNHTKPIPCRVPKCGQRFGRSQDLRRHENSAHKAIFGGKKWFCGFEECATAAGSGAAAAETPEGDCEMVGGIEIEMADNSGQGVGLAFPRRDNLLRHLRKKHGLDGRAREASGGDDCDLE